MPLTSALNKIRVVNGFGDGSYLGLADPAVGMVTQEGTITALDAGNGQVTVSGDAGVSLPSKCYPHQLEVKSSDPTLNWHSVNDPYVASRNNIWPNGVPNGSGSPIAICTGNPAPLMSARGNG
jgi:hypothetical protein